LENSTPLEAQLSQGGYETGYQAGFQAALEQAFNRQQALMQTRSNSVYSTGITTKTAGSKDRYKSISGQQLDMVP